jgi:NADPH:quinone reductase-like Zn-dependent oxidoreductase
MKALRRSHTGTLSLTETAVACSVNNLANDELLVIVAVASVNPADIKAGGSTPYSTGLDGAGLVIGVGGDDDTNLLGKRVT